MKPKYKFSRDAFVAMLIDVFTVAMLAVHLFYLPDAVWASSLPVFIVWVNLILSVLLILFLFGISHGIRTTKRKDKTYTTSVELMTKLASMNNKPWYIHIPEKTLMIGILLMLAGSGFIFTAVLYLWVIILVWAMKMLGENALAFIAKQKTEHVSSEA